MTEQWRPVVGYEGLYEVSSQGRVRSLDRTVRYKDGRMSRREGRVLRSRVRENGHLVVTLSRDGIVATPDIHRLMAQAFILNPMRHPVVRHLNDIPTDNRVANLAWGTESDNKIDSVRNGIHPQARKTHCPQGHEYTAENTYMPPGRPNRQCRTCLKRRKQEWEARRRGQWVPK